MKKITGIIDGFNFCEASEAFVLSKGVTQQSLNAFYFESAKATALTRINQACEDHIYNSVFARYPKIEVDTFDTQVRLALAYAAEPGGTHVALAALAAEKQTDIDVLAQKILSNHQLSEPKVLAIIGHRQQLEDQINAVAPENINQLENIKWEDLEL